MKGRGRPTVRSRQVAAELRRHRKAAGLSTAAVGGKLGVSQSKISRIETNRLGLHEDEVSAMLGLYEVPERQRQQVMDLVRKAAEPGWVRVHGGGLPDTWQALIDWETRATALRNYEQMLIPGLVQTADYARAIISGTAAQNRSESELDAKVAARLGRQGILSRTLPPALHVIIGEAALRTPVGSQRIMAAQLRHLCAVAERDRLVIQVAPLGAGPHPGLIGAFLMLDFAAEPGLVHLDNAVQSIFIEEQEHLAYYEAAWQRILSCSLPPKRSVQLIANMADTLDRPSRE